MIDIPTQMIQRHHSLTISSADLVLRTGVSENLRQCDVLVPCFVTCFLLLPIHFLPDLLCLVSVRRGQSRQPRPSTGLCYHNHHDQMANAPILRPTQSNHERQRIPSLCVAPTASTTTATTVTQAHAFGWDRFRIMRMVRTTLSPQVPGDGTDFCNINPLFWKYLQATRTWTR